MAVYVDNVSIQNLQDEVNLAPTTNLQSCIGMPVQITVDFYVETIAVIDEATDSIVTFEPSAGLLGFPDNSEWILAEGNASFEDFHVGDSITIVGTASNNGTFTILEKKDTQRIRVSGAIVPETGPNNAYIYVSSTYDNIRYYWNFLENSASFDLASLIDGESRRAITITASPTAPTFSAMDLEGAKTSRYGTVETKGNTISPSGTRQNFQIKHTTIVDPLHLAGQYDRTVANKKPDYYDLSATIKYIFQIDAATTTLNGGNANTVQYDLSDGDTGWFGETYNGASTNYSISNVVLTDTTLNPLTQVDYNQEVILTFDIDNTTDTPFTLSEADFVLWHTYLPAEEAFYQENNSLFLENFVYDKALNQIDAGTVNGDNFGTDYQVLKSVEGTFVSTSKITITARLDYGTGAKAKIEQDDIQRYLLAVIINDRGVRDEVCLKVNINDFLQDTPEADIVNQSHLFIQHPYTDRADGTSSISTFPTDDIASNTDFTIDFTGRESDGIKILTITPQVILEKSGEADIILENTTIDVRNSTLVSNLFQNISVNQRRPFKINESSIRTEVDIQRKPSLDTGLTYGWNINYPFFNRWEEWESIGFLSNYPVDLLNTNEPFDGFNHFWYRYTTASGWSVVYRLKFTLEQFGQVVTQTFDSPMLLFDYNSNPDWTLEAIRSFDVDSGLELINGPNKYIQAYANTRLEASFTHASAIPVIDDLEMVFWIIVKEQGTIIDIRRASSVYVMDSDSYFIGIGGDVVDLTILGNTITGKVLLDGSKLPDNNEFTVFARLYDASIEEEGRLLQDGDFRLLQDGDNRLLQDQ